ncbi:MULTISPECIES: NUMOD4 motif-containing HNH endonuclease [Nocardia]|uniref:NUMOD4 motif-containing HNH endonuclease n=1 Tax=Nocardia TaxID=1817 RepID=UPI00189501C4|nr:MULTISPECIES: NUMOD4 motif-containing HNH endonuclease [Nocardia]MBF6326798.1 HNH endonuclease [Nocardia cyriacigeorgica]
MEWRDIPGFEGRYQASDAGLVRSLAQGRILKPEIQSQDRHMRVALYGDHGRRRALVHRLVLETFVGPAPSDRPICRHLNGNPQDNRLANLQWSTHSQNAIDKVEHGVCPMRSRTHCANGHPYDGDNLRWEVRNGRRHRTCRACISARNRRQYERRLARMTGKPSRLGVTP